jgi:FkbM family methyltransferase
MSNNKQDFKAELEQLERLSRGSKIGRLLAYPIHYIYGMFFSKFIYPIQKKGVLKQVNTFFGDTMNVVLPAGLDIYLVKGKSHDSEIRLAKLMVKELSEGDTYLDIGAHFGYFSLLAAHLVGKKGNVFAYEASKSTFSILEKNIAQHNNIKAFHNALSDKDETLTFFEFPVLFSEYNSLDVTQFEQESWYKNFPPQRIEVAATTLSNLVVQQNITPKIIKIDVEGAEYAVMEGAKQMLSEQSPMVVLEFLSSERFNSSHHKAAEILEKANFKAHTINDEGQLEPCPDVEKYLLEKNIDSENVVFVKK